eukprot:g31488.t1
MEVKSAEEEFNGILCPTFIKMGAQRDKAEACAECSVLSIEERKIREGWTDSEINVGGGEERLERKSSQREEQNFFKVGMPGKDETMKRSTSSTYSTYSSYSTNSSYSSTYSTYSTYRSNSSYSNYSSCSSYSPYSSYSTK